MNNGRRILGEVVTANYGRPLREGERHDSGPFDVFGSAGVVGKHSSRFVDQPTLVIGRKGSVGSVTYAPNGGWPIDTTFFLEWRHNTEGDWKYLYYALAAANLNKHEITTSIPGLNRHRLLETSIYFPNLSEQLRIAALLDKADGIRKKRSEALKLTEESIRSDFLKLVGQLPNDRVAIDEVLAAKSNAIRTGPFGSQLLHAEFTDSGIPVLGIDNVVTNRFRWAERRYVSDEKYKELRRYRVFPGDVMITIMGTTGRVCVAPDNLPECISTKHLCTITPDRQRLLPEYLWASLMWDPAVRAQATRECKGAIMEGWNMGLVRGLMIKLPAIVQQERFAQFVRKVEELRVKLLAAEAESNHLFGSLAQRAFSGLSFRADQ